MGYNDLHTQLLLQDLLDEMEAARSDSTTVDERLTTIESTASTLSGKVDTIESTIPTTGIYHASNYSSFAAAVTAIGSTVATLVVANSQTITASLDVATLAPNTTVVIIGGGYFTGESAVTLNLGKFEAPRRQVFYGLTVTFSDGYMFAPEPTWWGESLVDNVWLLFADGDATPSVAHGTRFKIKNTSPTTITGFDDGYPGQKITVRIYDNVTTFDFTSSYLRGNAGVDWTPSKYDIIECTQSANNYWYCNCIDCSA